MPSTVACTNRLAAEKSPYLLQHAHNPVDWYPWGDEAFAKARDEGKFVFLSIGYSTCHWCHVMERESFEDIDVAALLNSVCVPVKVDREERPDVDQVYMNVCQALNGNGGWPLTVLLTPERVPFFAGTYFPKESRYGRIGLTDLLRQAGAVWQQDPGKVRASAQELLHRLKAVSRGLPKSRVGAEAFDRAVETFRQQHDAARGGFGAPPKFPTPHNLVFLLRRYRRTGDPHLLRMVESTLEAMARGGLFDHLGGGFHRYSTDADWLLPHFEKMLYDQAGLASAYLEAFQATRRRRWADIARSVFDYVLRDLRAPQGAFFCAEDADSEGVEGKFYVWSKAEILEILGAEEGTLFCQTYGVAEEGNFLEEATKEKTGLNVLHLPHSSAVARNLSTPRDTPSEDRLARCRQLLFEQREGRIRPLRDEKILAGWNGLMIAALAQGARVLGEPQYADAAGRAADFVLSSLVCEGRLLRRWKDGEAVIPAFAEDYAFMAHGLLELYSTTLVPSRLGQALHFARELVRLFWDEEIGGLFDTAADGETLVLRPREFHDGAIPSANSLALNTFARLWLLTGDREWEIRARGIIDSCGAGASSYPAAFTSLLCGAALLLEPTREIVVAGDAGAGDTDALLDAVRSTYSPESTLLWVSSENSGETSALAPFAGGMAPVDGAAAAYVCEGFACRTPIVDPALLARVLSEPPSA